MARRCIRCGRPFCQYCKSSREGHEYCSQCLHLFVLGDGLAPETKTQKLFEVERYERLSRKVRRLTSILLPGSGHLLRGKALWGISLQLGWLAAWIACAPGLLTPIGELTGIGLRLDLLDGASVPAAYGINPVAVVAAAALVVIWMLGNVFRRES